MNFNDLLSEDMTFPSFPEAFPTNLPLLFASSNNICPLFSQIEQLSLDLHIQSLRVEVERVKRQKLKAFIKQIKQD